MIKDNGGVVDTWNCDVVIVTTRWWSSIVRGGHGSGHPKLSSTGPRPIARVLLITL